ncbi:formin-like protein 20, partial [Tanacetum coccineum]
VAALDMNESILDADQVENLIKFCPTKEEMELLKINKRPSWSLEFR